MKLRTKMLLITLSTIIFIFVSTITLTIINAREMAKNQAIELAKTTAREYAQHGSEVFNHAFNTADIIANTFEVMKEDQKTDRIFIIDMMKNLLENNEAFYGIWTVWEPNAFDGKDQEFKGKDYHDETGKFTPY